MSTICQPPKRIFLLAALLGALVVVPGSASARRHFPAPHISSVKCWPPKACGYRPHVVAPGGVLRLEGRRLRAKMTVLFPRRGSVRAAALTKARLRKANGFLVTVPPSAKSGRIRVRTRHGRRSNAAGPIKIKLAVRRLEASGTPFDGTGMWIWYVSRSSGGDPAAIVAQATRYGVRTVFIKSSDGTTWWQQFSPELVSALKAGGLRVCAWQFVYGSYPSTEADLGARAAATGADCLVIDAESQYQGKYAQAQSYVEALRPQIGPSYPLGLAGFPYVDFHPAFPYSVFLGPGGAQYSLPQIYWKAIGTSVGQAFAHTYTWNQVYQRPIFPLGQLYGAPPPADIQRFRQLATVNGATGMSWWSWQSASLAGWSAISSFLPPWPAPQLATGYPALARGSRGDVVVWAQEHLTAGAPTLDVNGIYDSATEGAVRNIQALNGLAPTGRLDATTWPALLRFPLGAINWAKGARASQTSSQAANGPRSARLHARRNELAGAHALRP